MIFYKSFHRAGLDIANGQAEAFGCFTYLVAEVEPYIADDVYRQPRTPVYHCIALEELRKAVLEHNLNLRYILVLAQEWCKTGKPTVRQRAVVCLFENCGNVKVVLLEKLFAETLW